MNWLGYLICLALSLLWCATILGFPWLVRSGHLRLAVTIFWIFSKICHQDPLRSFSFAGIALPACSRCTAIFLGGLLGMAISPLLRILPGVSRKLKCLVVLATTALSVDIALDLLSIWNNTFLSRSMTGALFGLSCGLFFVAAILRISPRSQ
jgi:uncharacterized membrane protein